MDVESGALEMPGRGLINSKRRQVVRLVGTNPIQIVSLDASYATRSRRFPISTRGARG
jgi:hypothetical protein